MIPSVSIIIPVRNGERYVAQAIDSALSQRGVRKEVIVIDRSTDSTWRILEGYGDSIRKLRQVGKGLAGARNEATQQARGEWLAFLDADDAWHPEKLAKQLALTGPHTGMVYTERNNFGDCGRVSVRQSKVQTLWEGDVFERLLFDNFITVSSVMIRKECFDRVGGFDVNVEACEDWDLWLRHTAEGSEVRACREPLTYYRWHADSATNNHEWMCDWRVKVVQRALALPRGRRVAPRVARRALASAWAVSAWYVAPVMPRKALGWYLRSAWYWPWDSTVYKGIVKCCVGRN